MQLRNIALDFETYYDGAYSLSKITTLEYVRSELYETIMVVLQDVDTGDQWYAVGEPDVANLLHGFDWSQVNAIAHNMNFDGAILGTVYNIHPARLSCTLAMSTPFHASSVGGSLAKLAQHYNLPDKGTAVHNMLGKRLVDMSTQERNEYLTYCAHDVSLCVALYKRFISMLPPRELSVIDATLRMYTKPLLTIDIGVVEPHLRAVETEQEQKIQDLLAHLTTTGALPLGVIDGETMKAHCSSTPKFSALLESVGIEVPMKLNKKNALIPALAKTDPGMEAMLMSDDPTEQLLAETRLAVKSTLPTTRAKRFLELAVGGALPFPLKYFGAEQTGRWSAWDAINMQNLPRTSPLRDSLTAPEGHIVVAGDLSQVELRTGLWLAGQDDRLGKLRRGEDLYKETAASALSTAVDTVTKDQRQMGKVTDLSAIFGVSAPVVQRTIWLMGRVRVDSDMAQRLVATYRANNPRVCAAWREGERALQMLSQGVTGPIWGGRCEVTSEGVKKPSGLLVRYRNLRQQLGADGREEWVYDKKLGRTIVATKVYGAKVYQNCVQSIARDIMAVVVKRVNDLRLKPPYLQPVGLIHDELIGVTPIAYAQKAAELLHLAMTTPIAFCPNVPLACEVESGVSYGTCERVI
jgi:hypothetical protein